MSVCLKGSRKRNSKRDEACGRCWRELREGMVPGSCVNRSQGFVNKQDGAVSAVRAPSWELWLRGSMVVECEADGGAKRRFGRDDGCDLGAGAMGMSVEGALRTGRNQSKRSSLTVIVLR